MDESAADTAFRFANLRNCSIGKWKVSEYST
jgi:hypothetical protein